MRDGVEVGARLTEMLLQEGEAALAEVAAGADAERLHPGRCRRSHAVEARHLQRLDEGRALLGRNDEHAVRLAHVARQLGEELVVRGPRRGGQPGALQDLGPDLSRHGGGGR